MVVIRFAKGGEKFVLNESSGKVAFLLVATFIRGEKGGKLESVSLLVIVGGREREKTIWTLSLRVGRGMGRRKKKLADR